MAGVLRVDDLWANENWVSLPKIQAKCRAAAAALTGDTRAAVLHCVTLLEDPMLRELQRRVRDAGWWWPLRAQRAPLSCNEWVAPILTQVGEGNDYVPETVIQIHSTSSQKTAGARWDIDEDTGMLTAATPATVSMDTDDLHRVVMTSTRRGRLAVLGFADTVSSRDASHLIASGSTTSMGVYSAAWGRRQLEPPVTTPVIGPIHATLERRGREYVDPGELLLHVRWLRWHRSTQDYWWRLLCNASMSARVRSRVTRLSSARYCPWCLLRSGYHEDSIDHMLDICPAWDKLERWVHATLRRAGLWDGDATLGPGAVRGDTLLLGAGAACTTPAQLAVHGAIWESALRAINGLLTGLRVDDTDFTADDPPTRASVLLRRLITVDYHAATTRSGHPLRPKSVRDFAHKWRGLVRTTRRAIECLF